MVIEIGLQPLSDVDLHPFDIEVEADLAIGGLRIGDGVDLAQHALAVIVQRAREQLPLGRERDLVGALRRAQTATTTQTIATATMTPIGITTPRRT